MAYEKNKKYIIYKEKNRFRMNKSTLQKIILALYLVVALLVALGLTYKGGILVTMLILPAIILVTSFFLARTWKQKDEPSDSSF